MTGGRARRAAASRSSEAHFQQQVEQLAAFYSWRTYHTHDSRRSQPGFPDLVLVRPPELIFAELKTDKGRVRPEQAEWIADLETVSVTINAYVAHSADAPRLEGLAAAHGTPSVDVFLWRPADFDAIVQRLARGRTVISPLYRDDAA